MFETKTSSFHYTKCDACLSVRLSMKIVKGLDGVSRCRICNQKKYTINMFSHPVWFKDGKHNSPQYDLPHELCGLSEGEKLLIQQVSPYVPLQHLQKGSFGSKGHVCSFPQDISEVCLVLPRLPTDICVVNVVKEFRDKDNVPHKHTFRIRKQKVLDALAWLKQYNVVYSDIVITTENLDWIDGSEGFLGYSEASDSLSSPQEDQAYVNIHDNPHSHNTDPPVFGMIQSPPNQHNPSNKYNDFTSSLQVASKKASTSTSLSFPYVSSTPVNEYDTTLLLFCKAFPWLFPGGRGDFNDCSEVLENVDDWMRRLLYYQDGRFAQDKIWSFFALNYAVRKKIPNPVPTLLMDSLKMVPRQSQNYNNNFKMETQVGSIVLLTIHSTLKGHQVIGDLKEVKFILG